MSAKQAELLRMVWRAQVLKEYEVTAEECSILYGMYDAGIVDAMVWGRWTLFTPRVLSFAKRAA